MRLGVHPCRQFRAFLLAGALLPGLASAPILCAAEAPPAVAASVARPATWAAPIALPGCPNLHQVTPAIYRGAQPTAEGFRHLRADLGVKTVICLRSGHSDAKVLAGLGLAYEQIPMKAWDAESEDVAAALRLLSDPTKGPFFIHCQHGADRTGIICASYRIVIQGWSHDDALREMTEGGFGFHGVWQNLVRYVSHLNAATIQRQMAAPPRTDNQA